MAAITTGFSGGCAGKTNVELVIHRLSHLYPLNGVVSCNHLFCTWDEYVNKYNANTKVTMQKLARLRMDAIWAGWQLCIQINPQLADSNCPQYVGLYLDAHVPLVLHKHHVTVAQVLCKQLTPEQSLVKLQMSQHIVAAVTSVWNSNKKPKSIINDLFMKGKPGVLSVRYIRPQLLRCGSQPHSQMVAMELIKAWIVGKHSTRQTIAPPAIRISIAKMSFEHVLVHIQKLTSRQLYYIIAECIAVVTISHAPLHVMAAGVCNQFQTYFTDATSAYHRKKRGVVSNYTALTAASTMHRIEQWPLCTARQTPDTMLPSCFAHACETCVSVHIKTIRQPRAAKCKSGVSIDLTNPYTAICNQCGHNSKLVEISNHITRAKVNGKNTVICLCAKCCTICINPQTIGQHLYCASCADAVNNDHIQNAHACPCGQTMPYNTTPTFITLLDNASVYQTIQLCSVHAPMAYDCAKLRSVQELIYVFKQLKN